MWAHNLHETFIWVLRLTADDPFHPFSPDEWTQQTTTQMRAYLIQHLRDPHGPEPVPSGLISSTRPTGYSTEAIKLMDRKRVLGEK